MDQPKPQITHYTVPPALMTAISRTLGSMAYDTIAPLMRELERTVVPVVDNRKQIAKAEADLLDLVDVGTEAVLGIDIALMQLACLYGEDETHGQLVDDVRKMADKLADVLRPHCGLDRPDAAPAPLETTPEGVQE